MQNTPQPTSVSLLSRLRDSNDAAAWREFDGRYRELLLRFCRRRGLTHADADDVVQHVFTNLARALPNFLYDPERGRFRDYLYRCTRNSMSALRRSPNIDPQQLYTEQERASDRAAGSANPAEAQVWEEEWIGHHYRLAMETIRQTFDPQSLRLFERSLEGAAVEQLCDEFALTPDAIYKARQRVRARMQELIARQIREEDEDPGLPSRPA